MYRLTTDNFTNFLKAEVTYLVISLIISIVLLTLYAIGRHDEALSCKEDPCVQLNDLVWLLV